MLHLHRKTPQPSP
ncbi:hypothetical protein LINPERPRIM_LOCUS9859 [Linum perenne]